MKTYVDSILPRFFVKFLVKFLETGLKHSCDSLKISSHKIMCKSIKPENFYPMVTTAQTAQTMPRPGKIALSSFYCARILFMIWIKCAVRHFTVINFLRVDFTYISNAHKNVRISLSNITRAIDLFLYHIIDINKLWHF